MLPGLGSSCTKWRRDSRRGEEFPDQLTKEKTMHRPLHHHVSDRPEVCCQVAVLLLLFLAVAPNLLAQTHVANPFVGATQYVNPDYVNEINQGIAAETNQTLIQKMQVVKTYPTAVWMDRIAAINGGGGRLGLQ